MSLVCLKNLGRTESTNLLGHLTKKAVPDGNQLTMSESACERSSINVCGKGFCCSKAADERSKHSKIPLVGGSSTGEPELFKSDTSGGATLLVKNNFLVILEVTLALCSSCALRPDDTKFGALANAMVLNCPSRFFAPSLWEIMVTRMLYFSYPVSYRIT